MACGQCQCLACLPALGAWGAVCRCLPSLIPPAEQTDGGGIHASLAAYLNALVLLLPQRARSPGCPCPAWRCMRRDAPPFPPTIATVCLPAVATARRRALLALQRGDFQHLSRHLCALRFMLLASMQPPACRCIPPAAWPHGHAPCLRSHHSDASAQRIAVAPSPLV